MKIGFVANCSTKQAKQKVTEWLYMVESFVATSALREMMQSRKCHTIWIRSHSDTFTHKKPLASMIEEVFLRMTIATNAQMLVVFAFLLQSTSICRNKFR